MTDATGDLFYTDLVQAYVQRGRFTPRQWLADDVAEKMEQPNCRYVLLTAEPGAGKTAFAAWQAQQHPDWLRYFIRRDSLTPLSSGDIRSFLFTLGHQLAASKPELYRPDILTGIVQQRIGTIQPGGKAIGILVDDLVVSPFYQTALKVEQNVEVVGGDLIGLSARRIVTEPRFLDPFNLLYLALLDPAAALQKQDPGARLVALVDALDELRYQGQGETLLSAMAGWPELPDNVRFVLTARGDDDLLKVFRQRQKDWLKEANIPSASVMVQEDLRSYFSGFCADPPVGAALKKRNIKPQAFVEQARAKADGNFQYAAALTRGIEAVLGEKPGEKQAAALDDLLQLKGVEQGLNPLYAYFISQVRDWVRYDTVPVVDPQSGDTTDKDAWQFLYRPVMGALAVSQTPLNPAQILAFGGLAVYAPSLADGLARLKQFLDPVEGGYRFYHATLRDFLTAESTFNEHPECYLGAAEWHRRTADALLRACGKNWKGCTDEYALQYTPAHLLGAAGTDAPMEARPALLSRVFALAHSDDYAQAYLKRYRTPGRLLRFLQEALGAALQQDDLTAGWKLIGRYQSLLGQERDFTRLSGEVKQGDLHRALERSEVYAGQPNALALVRMWIAWLAASAEDMALAEAAAKQSLDALRGQIANPELALADPQAAYEKSNRLEIILARLLARSAWSLETANLLPVPPAGAISLSPGRAWYDALHKDHPFLNDWRWKMEYDLGRESWTHDYDYTSLSMDPVARLGVMEGEILSLDPSLRSGEGSMQWRDELGYILTHTFDRSDWQAVVERSVKLISLDDYPSYREMSLAWLATAVAAHPDEGEAQRAIQAILNGMLSAREPELPEDAKAMALGWRLQNVQPAPNAQDLGEALRQGLADRSESLEAKAAMGGRGRHDPWAWDVRRANAIAGVLARLKGAAEAGNLLQNEARQGNKQSFAGYRCLAYLAVALRWLELGDAAQAHAIQQEARLSAENMNDEIIKRQRLDLIAEVSEWLAVPPPAPADEVEAQALIQEAAARGGMLRSYRLQYLSAVWREDTALLKALLTLALEDLTATDAILGRLLGTMVAQAPVYDEALTGLMEAMKLG
jgi:hypothetical protein